MNQNLWSAKQKQDYDEWAFHYETYQKWLAKKPQEHQLYNMAVNNIKKKCCLEYYRGFLEAIGHMIAVIQDSLESVDAKKAIEAVDLKKTFTEYCNVLLGYLSSKNFVKKNDDEEESKEKTLSLLETAEKAVPREKSSEFYQGFKDGCEQMSRLVALLYDDRNKFPQPFHVLKTIFLIQSGYSIGAMIENWPQDRVPRYQRFES